MSAEFDDGKLPLLEASSTLSEGKMILKNLSINSSVSLRQSYSAEIAELCGPSPINAVKKVKDVEEEVDLGKTPKKRNTSNKKNPKDVASVVFRLDKSMTNTPAALRLQSNDDDSPTMMDLIGGADTPTTGFLLSSMENAMTDESSLNRHLRGQSFTPLPHAFGGDDLGSSGHFGLTPQLSWTLNGSPLGGDVAEPSPCFGFGLSSTRSRKKNPLSSPRSFWKDDFDDKDSDRKGKSKKDSAEKDGHGISHILSMLSPTAMDANMSDTSIEAPIPLFYDDKRPEHEEKRECAVNSSEQALKTPLRSRSNSQVAHASPQLGPHPMPHGSPWAGRDYRRPAYMHSPIPNHHSHHPNTTMSPFGGHYGDRRRDGPPAYGAYPPSHHSMAHHHQNDRVRNLRGRAPPSHHMPPPHHLPPPTYHHTLTSPLIGGSHANQRGRIWSHQPHVPHQLDMAASKRKCVPVKAPIPSRFQGDIDKYKDAQVPEFNNLVNFPGNMNNIQKQTSNVPEGMKCCVMCGQACMLTTGKHKKCDGAAMHKSGVGPGMGVAPLGDNNHLLSGSNKNGSSSSAPTIPTQNKGLCTHCDVNVWIVTQSGLEIKWCKGCKNFRPWAAFGDKGLATKCVRCRDRQREKYALQKEEKERARGSRQTLNAA